MGGAGRPGHSVLLLALFLGPDLSEAQPLCQAEPPHIRFRAFFSRHSRPAGAKGCGSRRISSRSGLCRRISRTGQPTHGQQSPSTSKEPARRYGRYAGRRGRGGSQTREIHALAGHNRLGHAVHRIIWNRVGRHGRILRPGHGRSGQPARGGAGHRRSADHHRRGPLYGHPRGDCVQSFRARHQGDGRADG